VEAGGAEIEEGAEAPQAGVGAGARGAAGQRLDGVDQGVAGVDIDSGVAIGGWRRGALRRGGPG